MIALAARIIRLDVGRPASAQSDLWPQAPEMAIVLAKVDVAGVEHPPPHLVVRCFVARTGRADEAVVRDTRLAPDRPKLLCDAIAMQRIDVVDRRGDEELLVGSVGHWCDLYQFIAP